MARSKFEIRAHKQLEQEGYTVDWKARPSYAGRFPTDFFHLFDLVAVKRGEPIRWISIKSALSGGIKPHREAIEAFWLPKGNQKELWRYDRDPKHKNRIRCRIQILESTT